MVRVIEKLTTSWVVVLGVLVLVVAVNALLFYRYQQLTEVPATDTRQLLGLVIIVLSFVLPGLIVSWKLSHARVSILDIIRGKPKQAHPTRAAEPKNSMLRAEWTTDVPRRCRRHRVKYTPRRRDHRNTRICKTREERMGGMVLGA